MLRLWLLYAFELFFIDITDAVRCEDIGWPLADGTPSPNPDPFATGKGWDIVKAQDCWVRFQNPVKKGEDPRAAKITTTTWTATPAQVLTTINNFWGSPNNIMLWFRLSTDALQYAGILSERSTGVPYEAQKDLISDYTVVSIILPSGVSKLRAVEVDPCERNENTERLWAWGANGQIATTDYAYTSWLWVERAAAAKIRRDFSNTWVTAETSDSETCVVIDFRTFPGI